MVGRGYNGSNGCDDGGKDDAEAQDAPTQTRSSLLEEQVADNERAITGRPRMAAHREGVHPHGDAAFCAPAW